MIQRLFLSIDDNVGNSTIYYDRIKGFSTQTYSSFNILCFNKLTHLSFFEKKYTSLCFIIHFWSWRFYCPTNLDTKNWITWQDKGGSAYRVLVCYPPPCLILGVEKEMSGDSVCSGARSLCIIWKIITSNTITRHPSTFHYNTITAGFQ